MPKKPKPTGDCITNLKCMSLPHTWFATEVLMKEVIF